MQRFVLCASTVLGLMLASGVAYAAANECTARMDGTLAMRKEGNETKTIYTGDIDVSVEAECAIVEFDIVVFKRGTSGEVTEERLHKEVKVHGSSPTPVKVDYELRQGRSVVTYRTEQTSCRLCED